MLNIALFGPPGAGKGTQSEFLIKHYNLFYISTGDLLRKEMAAKPGSGSRPRASSPPAAWSPTRSSSRSSRRRSPTTRMQWFPLRRLSADLHPGLHSRGPDAQAAHLAELPHQPRCARGEIRAAPAAPRDDFRPQRRQRDRDPEPPAGIQREDAARAPVLSGAGASTSGSTATQRSRRSTADHPAIIRDELSKRLFNVVLFGYPGSGRGSQGTALARKFGLEYVATGPMLDQEIKAGHRDRPEDRGALRERPARARRDRGAAHREEARAIAGA